MKKKIFGAVVVVAIVVGALINVNLNKVSNKGNLALAKTEALAEAELGPIFTNWHETTFTCTKTVGFDYILVRTISTTYLYVGCGYGQGSCLSPGGC
jgi:hypothetical protein